MNAVRGQGRSRCAVRRAIAGFNRKLAGNLSVWRSWLAMRRGRRFAIAGRASAAAPVAAAGETPAANPLWEYFVQHVEGRGIFKWRHYFEIYHRHLARFVGQPVNVVEVGVLDGGSLEMWAAYFGPQCRVYGIDINPLCAQHQQDRISIFIGDQQDRRFWATFKQQAPEVEILIDDGGHRPEQQMVTLEAMLPHLRPGGVYICEDIHGIHNTFAAFASGLASQLNQLAWSQAGSKSGRPTSSFQQAVHSIHFYPYMLVIEKHLHPPLEFEAIWQGTEAPRRLPAEAGARKKKGSTV